MHTTDPHYREAAAAEAAIADFYGKVWKPKPGDRVRGELPFLGTYGEGVVTEVNDAYITVRIGNEHLVYYPEDLERVVEPCRPVEPLTTPAQPGTHNAAAARRAGCEDAYDNAMQARYGEGW